MEKNKYAGQTVVLKSPDEEINNKQVIIEDWFFNITGTTWKDESYSRKPLVLKYALRNMQTNLPNDEQVVVAKFIDNDKTVLIHESEIAVMENVEIK